jgi:hypothetical protein
LVDAAPNLEQLQLDETKISDSGLVHLRKLTHLRTLEVRGTNLSVAAIAILQNDLPKCTVKR